MIKQKRKEKAVRSPPSPLPSTYSASPCAALARATLRLASVALAGASYSAHYSQNLLCRRSPLLFRPCLLSRHQGKWSVPLPKVRAADEAEVMKVVRTGKSKRKAWKRMITKHTFVGEGFTRKPPKFERFIRPMGLRTKKAHITHPELKATFCLPIIGVKKNPNSPLYTQLGVLTKGTVIEVNVSELGMVTTGGKVIWGKYAQVTNNPENDGCVNGVLLV